MSVFATSRHILEIDATGLEGAAVTDAEDIDTEDAEEFGSMVNTLD